MKDSAVRELEKKVQRYSIVLVIVIFGLKIIPTFFTNSLSFYAEFSDSIIDILAVSITFFSLKESHKPADFRHMFGHYKINSFSALFQGLLIVGLYGSILYNSIVRIVQQELAVEDMGYYTIIVLIISLIIVNIVARVIERAGNQTQNALIIAQGVNFRGDTYRNLSVIIGLVFIRLGFNLLDVILAIVFSLLSIKEAGSVLKKSFYELTDANVLEEEQIEKLENELRKIGDIDEMGRVQIKTTAQRLEAIVNISISQDLSIMTIEALKSKIAEIIQRHFPNFNCKSIVQLNYTGKLSEENVSFLIQTIKETYDKEHPELNIHDIYIDTFTDRILIQFHFNLDPEIPLLQAHEISVKLEEMIEKRIAPIYPTNMKFEFLSHIEPREYLDRKHSHTIEAEHTDILKELIRNILSSFSQVKEIREILIEQESEGIFIKLKLAFDGSRSVEQTHHDMHLINNNLALRVPRVKRCIIHPEPI